MSFVLPLFVDAAQEIHVERTHASDDPLITRLQSAIRFAVRILAVLMVALIFWGVADIVWILYRRLATPPYMILRISDILASFGAFLVVLIAIEIFENIILYLREDVIHVRLVVATALMAIARKVIILDLDNTPPTYVFAIATVVMALGVTYWLIAKTKKHQ